HSSVIRLHICALLPLSCPAPTLPRHPRPFPTRRSSDLPAPLRPERPAGNEFPFAGRVLPGPGPRLGTLRHGEGAGNERRTPAGRARITEYSAPLYLSRIRRLQRLRFTAFHESHDQRRSAPARAGK